MRHYRMGLIQTHEQLRFSYQVIIEGSKLLLKLNNANDNNVPLNANNNSTEFKPHLPKTIERSMGISEDDDNDNEDDNIVNNELCSLPPLPTKYRRSHSTTSQSSTSPEPESDKKLTTQNLISFNQDEDNTLNKEHSNNISNEEKVENTNKKKEQELRQRIREEKKKKTEETIERMKRKQKQAEARSRLMKHLIRIGKYSLGLGLVVLGAGYFIYKNYYTFDYETNLHDSNLVSKLDL